MATISVTKDLDVDVKYKTLVKQSLSGESAYIRAKETIQELVADGALDDAEKSKILSEIVGSVVNNINSTAMSTAMSWANAEKEVELRKLELEKTLDILDEDLLLKTAQADQIENAIRLSKVESKRMFGTATFDGSGNIISLSNEGKVAKDIELTTAQISKSEKEVDLLTQKVNESYAAIHKIVADTYVNFGNYSYSGLSDTGISTVTANHGSHKTLSDTQQDIAIEQAKGYVYNAWANALTGSASMLGTAISSGLTEFEAGGTGETLLNNVLDIASNLKAASTTVDDAVPIS